MSIEEVTTDLQRLETLLLNPSACSRPDTLWPLFANEFTEIGSSGRLYDREQAIAGLTDTNTARREMSEFRVTMLAENVALVTYRAVRHVEPPQHSLRSSIWWRRGLRWQITFHQGTPIAP